MSQQEYLADLCSRLSDQLRERYATFQGHAVRIDAGDPGMIYVALRDARREAELGQKLAERLEARLDAAVEAEPKALDYAISVGSGNRDLLLQIEFRFT